MSLAAISVAALVLALAVSCTSTVNVGVLAIVLAWVVGVYFGGLSVAQVVSGFPTSLFLTLVGVTLLFAQAQVNGTLDRIAQRTVGLCRGHAGIIPIMFFFLTAGLASIGPGNIAAAALVAPTGMAVASRYGISLFLMAIMVGNGASAGALSPLAPTGIIVDGIMPTIGLPDAEWRMYLNNFFAHAVVAFGGYFLLGGWKLFVRREAASIRTRTAPARHREPRGRTRRVRDAALAHAGRHRGAAGRRHRVRPECGDGCVCRGGRADARSGGRRGAGDARDAVARDRHGDGRHRAHRAARDAPAGWICSLIFWRVWPPPAV